MIRVVSPFRPFEPESLEHRELGPFDWVDALRMLAESVRRSMDCETVALTDVDTNLPVPSFRYRTEQRRLMLWILEVSLAYLESKDFDRDTIMISPDTLIFGDLRTYFANGDLALLVRSDGHFADRPILNAIQWWPVKSKKRLVRFYREVLQAARQLPESQIVWGADSEALRVVLDPVRAGLQTRARLRVWMIESVLVLQSLSTTMIAAIEAGDAVPAPVRPILDFKYTRKRFMRAAFDALIGSAVPA